jgi:hypothetical protein
VFPGNGAKKKPHWEAGTLEHGHLDATLDPDLATHWFRKWPQALVCSPVAIDEFAIDIDPRNGGTRASLEAMVGPLPDTRAVWSGRNDGGHHLFYSRPAGINFVSTRLPDGIDLKDGGKGYTVLPPSTHAKTKKPYRWDWKPIAYPSDSLIELLRAPEYTRLEPGLIKATSGKLAGLMRTVGESSTRELALYWALCRAVEARYDQPAIEALCQISRDRGLPEGEIRNALRQAHKTNGVVA